MRKRYLRIPQKFSPQIKSFQGMMRKVIMSFGLFAVLISAQQVGAWSVPGNRDDSSPASVKFSEIDTYLDLNSGKQFRFIYDELNDIYNRADLMSLDLYVNTRTRDTFWLEDAIVVNNALLKDETSGKYRIDPAKVKRDGNTYKVKSTYGR